jgi:hypothetical protein
VRREVDCDWVAMYQALITLTSLEVYDNTIHLKSEHKPSKGLHDFSAQF